MNRSEEVEKAMQYAQDDPHQFAAHGYPQMSILAKEIIRLEAALTAAESLAAERGREVERLRGSMMRYPKGSIVPEWTHYCADEHEPVASLGRYCPVCHTDAEGNKSPALSTPPQEGR